MKRLFVIFQICEHKNTIKMLYTYYQLNDVTHAFRASNIYKNNNGTLPIDLAFINLSDTPIHVIRTANSKVTDDRTLCIY